MPTDRAKAATRLILSSAYGFPPEDAKGWEHTDGLLSIVERALETERKLALEEAREACTERYYAHLSEEVTDATRGMVIVAIANEALACSDVIDEKIRKG